jgi:hypothetical protein
VIALDAIVKILTFILTDTEIIGEFLTAGYGLTHI